jgi:hypothetical protein
MALDLYALIDHCALDVSARTQTVLHQLVVATSEGEPLHVLDLTDARVYTPHSVEQASALVWGLLEAGHHVRAGITLLDPLYITEQGWTITQLFDPCAAIGITGDMLEGSPSSVKSRLVSYLDPQQVFGLDGLVDAVLAQPAHVISQHVERGERWPGRAYTVAQLPVWSEPPPNVSAQLQPLHMDLLLKKDAAPSVGQPVKWTEQGIPPAPPIQKQGAPAALKVRSFEPPQAPQKRARVPEPPVTTERLPLSGGASSPSK